MGSTKTSTASIDIQDRDLALLRGLFESRLMTTEHAAALYFSGSRESAKKRLQKIKAAGLVGVRNRRVNEPAILFLARKGLNALREHGILTEYPALTLPTLERRARVGELTIRHELDVMDVKSTFHRKLDGLDAFSIAEFSTWPLLHQFEAVRSGHNRMEVLVRPDGFIRIHEKESDGGLSEHTFFLEVDRSSETLDALVGRATAYLHYYHSGGFAVKNGGSRSAYRDFPFRVLLVFKTAERRNNIAERLLQSNPPIFTQVCLSTMEEVTNDPLGQIWIRPLDYQTATQGTNFDSGRGSKVFGYQRHTARELFVEQKVAKSRLFSE